MAENGIGYMGFLYDTPFYFMYRLLMSNATIYYEINVSYKLLERYENYKVFKRYWTYAYNIVYFH